MCRPHFLLNTCYSCVIPVSAKVNVTPPPAGTRTSTRWRHCSSCTCASFLSLWCRGLSTKTSWTAPTRWTSAAHRCACPTDIGERSCGTLCPSIFCSCVLAGLGKVAETNCSPPQNPLQPSRLCLPVSRRRDTKHYITAQ